MESLGRSKKPEHDSELLEKEAPGKRPTRHVSSSNGSKRYLSSHYPLYLLFTQTACPPHPGVDVSSFMSTLLQAAPKPETKDPSVTKYSPKNRGQSISLLS